MNFRLFYLIHNERPYKRYYGQSLKKDTWVHRWLHEIRLYLNLFVQTLKFPFDKRRNAQQYPGERKSTALIVWENLKWALKYKETCFYYYLWGLDLKGKNPKDYIAYTEFRVIRNIINIRQFENRRTKYCFNYLALARDKFIFGQYANSLGFPVPQTIALITNGRISWMNAVGTFSDLSEILSHNFSAFCKECTGEGGSGAFLLEIKDGQLLINNEITSLEDLKDRTNNAKYIVQQRVHNHSTLARIYPYSVNTLRVVTVCKDNTISLFDARLRTGANGSVVDNACFGGVVVGISNDGILMDWGYQEPGKSEKTSLIVKERHPDTQERFAGVQIPFWNELLNLAFKFHGYYYGIPSIGWDIAITPDGPMFLECGEDWEIQGTQIFRGGRKKDFHDLHGYALGFKLRKY